MADEHEKIVTSLKVKQFSGSAKDWPEWKLKFQAVLHGKGLLKTLKTPRPVAASQQSPRAGARGSSQGEDRAVPAGGDADDGEEFGTISSGSMELEQWLENNEDIFYLLVIYTSGQAWTLVQQFATEASGKDAWEALVEKYEGAGNLGAVDLSRQLLLYKISETADPDIAFAEIEDLQRRLIALGQPYTDDMLRTMILTKLPPRYENIVDLMEGTPGHTYSDMKLQVRNYWRRKILTEESSVSEKSPKAMMTESAGGKPQGVCFGCGSPLVIS